VPKSRTRTKAVYTPPTKSSKSRVSPRWLAPTMVGSLVLGLVWIALYYVTSNNGPGLPIPAFGPVNLVIGFALFIFGVVLATRWY
jgi:Cell division protein CrgA